MLVQKYFGGREMDISIILINTMLGNDSLSALSKTTGASNDQVQKVLANALPSLLKGMQNNSSDQDGEASLNKALAEHAKNDTSDISAFMNNVDLSDGAKILGHILGDNQTSVAMNAAKKSGVSAEESSNILAAAAPLLLAILGGNQAKSGSKSSNDLIGSLASSLLKGDNLTDSIISGLGSLLGGGTATGKKSSTSKATDVVAGLGGLGGLGNLLGSVLGSSSSNSNSKEAPTKKTTTKKTSTVKKITKK